MISVGDEAHLMHINNFCLCADEKPSRVQVAVCIGGRLHCCTFYSPEIKKNIHMHGTYLLYLFYVQPPPYSSSFSYTLPRLVSVSIVLATATTNRYSIPGHRSATMGQWA